MHCNRLIIQLFLAFHSLSAIAQTPADKTAPYPNRPIRLILPFPPGAATDAIARVMAPKLAEAMGQQWVVENRGGAAGNIATEYVAKQPADGHTVLFGFSTVLTVNTSLYAAAGFDPIKDFAPVTQLATSQYKLIVHPSVPARSVKEFVALAKAQPGSLNYASAGAGSPLHLAAELFKSRAGVNMVHVAYKGGGPAATAVLAGESQLVFSGVANSMDHIKSGRLRALAVTSLKRAQVAPELPTLHESGYPGFNVTTWNSLLVPANTSSAIIARLHGETVKILRNQEVATMISRAGYETTGSSPDELSEMIRSESRVWAKVIKDANIRAE
jgi:tripartite-type tricarboxylate transporter receptor subunit TctC